MAKKFIARIEQPMSEEVLADLFTSRRKGNKSEGATDHRKSQRGTGTRKKSFMKALSGSREKQDKASDEYTPSSERRFLNAMEDVLNDVAFDSIFPTKRQQNKTSGSPLMSEVPFSLMISENIFKRAKQIAQEKGVRVKDVINLALERYIDQVMM